MYLSLNGQQPANDSEVAVTEIGESMEEALLCYTDNAQCCNTTDTNTGRWLQQNGADVGDQPESDFFVTKGPNVVRLHRRNSTFPSGTYCCEVRDARSMVTRVCARIGGLMFVNSFLIFFMNYLFVCSFATNSN